MPASLDALSARLDGLLSEPLESVRARRANALDEQLGGLDRPFVLFGAGGLGTRTLGTLKELGHRPVALIDNDPTKWGMTIGGLEVKPPVELVRPTDQSCPSVIITTWSAQVTDRITDIAAALRTLGYMSIAHFGHLAWRFPEAFLPYYGIDLPEKVIEAAAAIRQAFALLESGSRGLFVNHIEWRLTLDFELLPPKSAKFAYFDESLIEPDPGEVLYDVGGFTGDTQEYIDLGREYREIHSFEPEEENFTDMQRRFEELGLSGITAHRLAISDTEGTISIEHGHGAASRIGFGSDAVTMTTIDRFSAATEPPTLIKLDIEGAEPAALRGARSVIAEHAPAVAVCVYHAQDHIWSIPLQLHDYVEEYRFKLCPHWLDGWDLVLYAVPRDRMPVAAEDAGCG
jgi:FkbM family methyltransferase